MIDSKSNIWKCLNKSILKLSYYYIKWDVNSDGYVTSAAVTVHNTASAALSPLYLQEDKGLLKPVLPDDNFDWAYKSVSLSMALTALVERFGAWARPPPHRASCDRSNPQTNRVSLCLALAGGGASLHYNPFSASLAFPPASFLEETVNLSIWEAGLLLSKRAKPSGHTVAFKNYPYQLDFQPGQTLMLRPWQGEKGVGLQDYSKSNGTLRCF